MTTRDLLGFAFGALIGHRLRSALSLLGMSIGVAAVVILTSLGEGARRYVVEQFATIGSNLIIVVPGRNETTGVFPGVAGVPNDLTLADAQAVLRAVPEIMMAAPVIAAGETVSAGERQRDVAILGTTAEMMQVQDFAVAQGRFLPEGDWERSSPVAVLGSTTARELFAGENPIGQRIRIGDRRALVIGVLAERGLQIGVDFDDVVIIPVARAMQLFNRRSLFRLLLRTHAHADLESARQKVLAVLVERHGEEDVSILTQDAVVSTLSVIFTALTAALGAIAAVSLSVAGIGIMNVMLVSVSERTAEVGLLKAIGAGRRHILLLFLTEAAILSVAGALLGLLIGATAVAAVVAAYPAFPAAPPVWALVAALAVSLLCGLVFGVLPARRATRLDPIVALARR